MLAPAKISKTITSAKTHFIQFFSNSSLDITLTDRTAGWLLMKDSAELGKQIEEGKREYDHVEEGTVTLGF